MQDGFLAFAQIAGVIGGFNANWPGRWSVGLLCSFGLLSHSMLNDAIQPVRLVRLPLVDSPRMRNSGKLAPTTWTRTQQFILTWHDPHPMRGRAGGCGNFAGKSAWSADHAGALHTTLAPRCSAVLHVAGLRCGRGGPALRECQCVCACAWLCACDVVDGLFLVRALAPPPRHVAHDQPKVPPPSAGDYMDLAPRSRSPVQSTTSGTTCGKRL